MTAVIADVLITASLAWALVRLRLLLPVSLNAHAFLQNKNKTGYSVADDAIQRLIRSKRCSSPTLPTLLKVALEFSNRPNWPPHNDMRNCGYVRIHDIQHQRVRRSVLGIYIFNPIGLIFRPPQASRL